MYHEVTSAHGHHHRDLPVERAIWNVDVTHPALVLGSRQTTALIHTDLCERNGVDVVRRRSGGGIVYLAPSEQVWIDVVVPRGDVLWSDDVEQASWWLGQVWVQALQSLGLTDVRVHQGSLVGDEWADIMCFAGIGPGEVVVHHGAETQKIVGISQRRTSDSARFQCTIYMKWDPSSIEQYLVALPGPMEIIAHRVATTTTSAEVVLNAFVAQLP